MALKYVNGLFVDGDTFQDHSITFGDGTVENGRFVGTNTWRDWHLIPSSRPVVAEAGVSTNFVDIPGRPDGPIDMSEYLTGQVIYSARSGSFEFIVDNDFDTWERVRRRIVDFLHGKKMKMVLEDDPQYYFEGRFSFNEWRSDSYYSTITINYALEPYKRYVFANGDWLWDYFNFETDRTDQYNSGEKRL